MTLRTLIIGIAASLLLTSFGASAVVVYMQDFEGLPDGAISTGAERTWSVRDSGGSWINTNNLGVHNRETNCFAGGSCGSTVNPNMSGNVMGHITANYDNLEASYLEVKLDLSLFTQANRQLMFDFDSWISDFDHDDGFNVVAYTIDDPNANGGFAQNWIETEPNGISNHILLTPTLESDMQWNQDAGSGASYTKLDDVSGFYDPQGPDSFNGHDCSFIETPTNPNNTGQPCRDSEMMGVAMFDLSAYEHDIFNLRFSFGSGTASFEEGINIDNIKVTGDCINGGTDPTCQPGQGVPEPASLALAALGLTALYRRRSKAI